MEVNINLFNLNFDFTFTVTWSVLRIGTIYFDIKNKQKNKADCINPTKYNRLNPLYTTKKHGQFLMAMLFRCSIFIYFDSVS